ncbi:murein biosynthesis integral membrane protein MurJ [Schlesneria sp. DSM 10557]|uniref:murein biosynthesis integral membrane protein MurJ n=2 Tax=unclassified Schlesneria TaxID=2762017 RepID=UPI0035A1AE14
MNESLQQVTTNLKVVSFCTLLSRITGLLRDQAMGVMFGAGPVMDAFTVAFRLPNLARVLLGEGALTTAFLPVFVSEMREKGIESAVRVTWAVFITLAVFLSTMILLINGLLWSLTWYIPLSPEGTLLRNLTMALMPYVLLICLAAQLGAALNALGKFLWPALVPLVLNAVWLLSLWGIVPFWTDEITQVYVVAVCVLIGGVLQLIFPLSVLTQCGFGFRSDWRLSMGQVGRIARSMLPVVIGVSITQLNAVLDSFVAWGFTQPAGSNELMPLPWALNYPLREGTATALYLGQRLYQFPLGVFGVALGTVLFPLLTAHAQNGDSDKLRSDLSFGIRLVIAIGLPASAGLILIGQPLATFFFEYGKFDAQAAQTTGQMIAAYGSGVWAYCGLLILQRGFYAIGDRLTPMYIGLGAVAINFVLNLTLIWPLGGIGLAFSTAFVAAGQSTVTALMLQHKLGTLNWREIGITTLKTLTATLVMVLVCLVMPTSFPIRVEFLERLVRLVLPMGMGGLAFLFTTRLVNLTELRLLLSGRRSRSSQEKAASIEH